ncbi:MAG: hypothetical protein NT157_02435 [Candidatus Micrarchaeota archaeon]|nr:hypothetical protein [Candidatus Micrarchaeota archaeon]
MKLGLSIGEDRIKSGIPGLDAMMEGGFVRESITIVGGGTGCGKTIFGAQFINEGILRHGENGLMISFDEHKTPFYSHMKRFGWDFEKHEREKKFVFIEYPAHEVEHFNQQEGVIRDLVDSVGVERLVIDSAMALSLIYESPHERMIGLIKLLEVIRSWGCATLILSENPENTVSGKPCFEYGIEHMSDGLIHLYNLPSKNERLRYLEIIKMRGTNHTTGMMPMSMSPIGISVQPKRRYED